MMHKTTILFAGLAAAIILSIAMTNPVNASSFDPGNIISDSIFTNSSTMTADQIQYFIEVKGKYCTDGEAPCLKNYRENGKSVGTIIYEISQQYLINPQVILATLQKEVGLVTISNPGSWRYRTAMGYGCPDSTPGVCSSQYFGFTNQVRWAATMFRAIMNNSPTWFTPYRIGVNSILWHPNQACGISNVNIVNRATVALYSYTPYRPNNAALAAGFGTGDGCSSYGNRNFWLYFNTWFGSSTSSILIQSPQSPAVYLQSGSVRYAIPSWDIINAYGFGRFGVTPVSNSYMNSLQDGGILNTVFSNKSEPGPIYLADNGYRFGFSSYQQCVDWGFPRCTDSSYTKPLEPSVFDRMYQYGAISPLMLNGSHLHIMKDGKKHTLLSHEARVEKGYANINYTPITNPANLTQPYAKSIPHNNSLVSFRATPAIYLYTNSKFYALSYDAFLTFSSKLPTLVDSFSEYNSQLPVEQGFIQSNVALSDGSLYSFVNGKKINLTKVKHHWPQAAIIDDLKTILALRSDDYTADENSTYRTTAGSILKVENKHFRGFYSLYDYFALGNTRPIPINELAITNLASGSSVMANGQGSVYQLASPANQSLILTPSIDGSPCQLSSLDQLGSYHLITNSVQRLAPSQQPISTLTNTAYDQDGNIHIIYSGRHAILNASELTSVWGVHQKIPACTFHKLHLAKIPVNSSVRFIRDPVTGIIYHGEGGKKQPIFSYAAFIRMGGSTSNTLDVSNEFITASPTGVAITE